jgi:hypothetical protein
MENPNCQMKAYSPPLKPRHTLWPWFVAGSVLLLIVIPNLPGNYGNPEVLIASVGGIWALAFYLHGKQGEDAKFLKELLSEFNRRYNKLNDRLRAALNKQGPFETDADAKFIDYFNVCAEEWVFWKGGYIPEGIWIAWANGMKQYGQDARVKELWERERRSNSYYGFEFPVA